MTSRAELAKFLRDRAYLEEEHGGLLGNTPATRLREAAAALVIKTPAESVNVGSCARCGDDHPGLDFEKLIQPIREGADDEMTHWAPCPTNGQPILMRLVPKTFACRR